MILSNCTSQQQILGMIENMASFQCPHCHHTTPVFLAGGVEREALKQNVPLLGSIPLNEGICADADSGRPSVVSDGKDGTGQIFRDIADRVLTEVDASKDTTAS
jgi:ATP-binding protein involved in chromosome partitioning